MSRRPTVDRLAAIVTLRGIQQEAAAAAAGKAGIAARAAQDRLAQSEHDLDEAGARFEAARASSRFDPVLLAGWAAAWRAQAAHVEQASEGVAAARSEEQARRLTWNGALALEEAAQVELRKADAHQQRQHEERRMAELAESSVAKKERM